MGSRLRAAFARVSRSTRVGLDITQDQLARATGVSRAHIAAIETGRANPTLDLATRIADGLGLEIDLVVRPPVVVGTRQRDFVHARCSAYVDRRLRAAGYETLREVPFAAGRSHGWIDLLAYAPTRRMLLVIEVKTTLDDLGGAERQLGWYERAAEGIARSRGWPVQRLRGWLLLLASDETDAAIRMNHVALAVAFPVRAAAMRAEVNGAGGADAGRGLAMIDPSSRRRDWLLSTRIEGRRRQAPYRDYADAATRWRSGERSASLRCNPGTSLGDTRFR